MVKKPRYKPLLFLLLLLAAATLYFAGGKEYLQFAYIKAHVDLLRMSYEESPWTFISGFLGLYVLITSLSIPGSFVLTLLAGAIFGIGLGTLLVSVAGSVGAVIAFYISRYLIKDFVMEKFSRHLRHFNRNLERDGTLYLFTLRMIPVSPYVIINLVMGVTGIKGWPFFWITLIGMIPGNSIYVFAGRNIGKLETASDIMTWPIIISLTLLGVLPLLAKRLLYLRRRGWTHG